MNSNVDTICHLSPLQHGMLHHSQIDRASGLYVEQFSCVLAGPLDGDRFQRAWIAVAHRHDALKTLFMRLHEEKPLQVVRRKVTLPFEREDWSAADPLAQQHRFDSLLASDRARGFDPTQAPLMRLRLVQLGRERHRFLWTYHHAILDGWSMPVVIGEVFELYAADAPALPAPRTDYRHYLAWLRQQDLVPARAYWKETLRGYRTPHRFAPSMAPGAAEAPAKRRLATLGCRLAPTWSAAAARFCRTHKITLNTLCQGAWSVLLNLYGDRVDVVHGIVVSGRPPELAGVDRMVGLFINTLPMRARLDGETPIASWLQQLQADTMQAERHAHSPLPQVLQCAEVPRQQALFDTLYVFENYPGQAAFGALAQAQGLRIEDVRAVEETNYALALIVLPDGVASEQGSVQFHLTYDTTRFATPAVERLADQYSSLLSQFVQSAGERMRVLQLWPATPAPSDAAGHVDSHPHSDAHAHSLTETPGRPTLLCSPSQGRTPHGGSLGGTQSHTLWAMLAHHATIAPGQPACVTPGWQIDYRALNQRIYRALRHWSALGYVPGDRVLLLPDDDDGATGLVMLLSALAYGIECLLTEPTLAPETLLSAGAAAWGSSDPRGCVATRPMRAPTDLRSAVFAPDLADGAPDGDAPLIDPMRGACALIGTNSVGEWTLLRYSHAQLVQAAEGFMRAYPAQTARDVPLAGSLLRHTNLWTTLMALGSGLTLHRIASADADDDLFRRVAAAETHWHSVRLNGAQTRRLGAIADAPVAGAIRTDHWIVDGCSLTATGARRLLAVDPNAALVREWRWPAHSLPHAAVHWSEEMQAGQVPPSALGSPVPGATLGVVDMHLRPAALDAFGRVVVRGSTVPNAWLRQGLPDPGACLSTREGALLLTDLRGWVAPRACHAELPFAAAALHDVPKRWYAIESALGTLDGTHEVALVECLTANREWQPTVFYVAAEGVQASDTASRLRVACQAAGLPDAAVVQVRCLPRNERGIDRRALLRGELDVVHDESLVGPRDALETALHAIWCELLKRDRIGVDQNYFDLGGQSLLASVMLYQIEEQLGTPVEMDTLLAHPTIAGLAQALRSGVRPQRNGRADLTRDAVLAPDIVPTGTYRPTIPEHVLLTGATGFLGVHLLADLLERTTAQVHCLVRAPSVEAGLRRLADALKLHGLWQEWFGSRLRAVPGELDRPLFGLAPAEFDALARTAEVIYHNGALVNFVYPYPMLKQVNVLATEEVLRLACLHKPKPVHYVSTVGVLDRTADALPEVLSVPLHDQLLGGYEQSKWVAEQLMCLAAARGLPVAIYRPSRIVGHSRTGRLNTDDLFCRLIKGIVLFGKAPSETGFDNMLPVDAVSRIIVEASLHPEVHGRAVHVVNPRWNSFDGVVDFIEAQGHPIERLDYVTWLEQLAAHVKRDPSHPLAMLIPVLGKLNPMADASIGRPMPIAHAHMERWASGALAALRPIEEWLQTYFHYLYSTGNLTPVDGQAHSGRARPAAAAPQSRVRA